MKPRNQLPNLLWLSFAIFVYAWLSIWEVVELVQNGSRMWWESTSGEIVVSHPEVFMSKGPVYRARVQYRYTVDEVAYESDKITDFTRYYDPEKDYVGNYPIYFCNENDIYKFYAPGKLVTVFYNPHTPNNSVLEIAFFPAFRNFVITQIIAIGVFLFWRSNKKESANVATQEHSKA